MPIRITSDKRRTNNNTMNTCDCWTEKDKLLAKKGYRLSDTLTMFTVGPALSMSIIRALPLQRLDGKRMKRGEPRTLTMSFCPFCGAEMKGGAE